MGILCFAASNLMAKSPFTAIDLLQTYPHGSLLTKSRKLDDGHDGYHSPKGADHHDIIQRSKHSEDVKKQEARLSCPPNLGRFKSALKW